MGMNSRLRKFAYGLCVKRDGEKCKICGHRGHTLSLVVDHVDDDDRHNPRDGSNWQLLCRRHNNPHLKTPAQTERLMRTQGPIDAPDNMSAEMRKNIQAERIFQHWVYAYVRKNGAKPFEMLVNMGAFKAKCSPVTSRRYLKKFSVPTGVVDADGPPLVRYYNDLASEDFIAIRTGAKWKPDDELKLDDEKK